MIGATKAEVCYPRRWLHPHPLHVLSVAFPFAPVSTDAVGGAEQVLAQLDRSLTEGGHRSTVIASSGSRVEGRLVPLSPEDAPDDPKRRDHRHAEVRATIEGVLDEDDSIDVVHFHGVDFGAYFPVLRRPSVVTVHLPPSFYPQAVWDLPVHKVFVSASQHRAAQALQPHLGAEATVITNGVDVRGLQRACAEAAGDEQLDARFGILDDEPPVVALGRVCPEKRFDVALEASKRLDLPFVLAGQVFPYAEHRRHFDRDLAPRLDARRRFVGPLGLGAKAHLLARARCLVVPSTVAETSSLVTMEALACGTPVVARAVGALPEIVEHGVTGLLFERDDELPRALVEVASLSRRTCRVVAQKRFSLARTALAYMALYRSLVARPMASAALQQIGGAEGAG